MGWDGGQMPPLSNKVLVICHPWEFFLHFSYYCITVVAQEKSPESMDELNLCLCHTLGGPICSCTHIIHLIAKT